MQLTGPLTKPGGRLRAAATIALPVLLVWLAAAGIHAPRATACTGNGDCAAGERCNRDVGECQPADCPADAVAFWKLDGSGGSVTDFVGGNDAACSGPCPGATAGRIDGGRLFDGATTGIDVPDDAVFDWGVGQSFSIEYWFKGIPGQTCFQGGSSNDEVAVGRNGGNVFWWSGCYNSGGDAAFVLDDDSTAAVVLRGSPVADGGWHHVAVVRDAAAGQVSLWVDGRLDDWEVESFSTGFAETAPLNVGWIDSSAGYHAEGTIDELAIYSRALTPREIRSHFFLDRPYCDMCSAPVRIMPLGDSITLGKKSGVLPDDESGWVSYRKRLWELLGAAGIAVDFVGDEQAGYLYDPPFDSRHEGHSGWTDDEIRDAIAGFLAANPADIVLLHIGTNSVDEDPMQVEEILDNLDGVGKEITVLLPRIINREDHVCGTSSTTTAFNDNVEAMALDRIDDPADDAYPDRIIQLDLECGVGIDYSIDMFDSKHPLLSGLHKMADGWMNGDSLGSLGLIDFLPVCGVIPVTGSIHVVKQSNPPGGTGFQFTGDLGSFSLDDGSSSFHSGLAAGDYDVTELAPAPGWSLTGATCTGAAFDSIADGVTVHLTQGDQATCTFSNTFNAPPSCPPDTISYWKLEETGAPTTFDDTWGGNDGQCSGPACPSPDAGILGGGQSFDGAANRIDVPGGDFDWSVSASFTLEFWARTDPASSCAGNGVVVGRRDGSSGLDLRAGCADGGAAMFQLIDTEGAGITISGSTDVTDGGWHHVACVRDNALDTNLLYVDGLLDGTGSFDYGDGFQSATASLTIGAADAPDPDAFAGTIDEVAIHDRALGWGEIAGHHAGGTGRDYCTSYPPSFVSMPLTDGEIGVPYAYDAEAAGHPVPGYALTQSPAGMAIDGLTGLVTWIPPSDGNFGVTIAATNSAGSADQPYTLTIAAPPELPEIDNLTLSSASGNDLFEDNLTCNYTLTGSATRSAVAWYVNGSPLMSLYMPMEGGSELAALLDRSGNGHSPLGLGAIWSDSGGLNATGGFFFDDDTILAGEVLTPGGGYTKTAWVMRTGNDGLNILSGDGTGTSHRFSAACGDKSLSAGHEGGPQGWCEVEDDIRLEVGQWYHGAVTYDATANWLRLYRDGVAVDAAHAEGSVSDATIYVGGYDNAKEWFGYMDDVRVYDRVLSPQQIAAIHAQGAELIVAPETAPGDQWECRVTPFSATATGITEVSNVLTIQSPGTPVTGAGFHNPDDANEFSWTARTGTPTYEVARSPEPDFFSACTTTQTTDPQWIDPATPATNAVLFYLVRTLTPLPASWGQDSRGVERYVCP